MGADLHIIPVLNKIDLPSANVEKYAAELAGIVGCEPEDVLLTSAKTGLGVEALLNEIVKQTPAPVGDADAPPRALIFDSVYDTYRGVVTYVRVDRRQAQPPRPDQDDVQRRRPRDARGRRDQPRADEGRATSASARSATSSPV